MADGDGGMAGRLRRGVHRVRTFIEKDLWSAMPEGRGARLAYRLLRMAVLVVEGFIGSEVFLLAAALTYQVVFALVPLLVVMLAVLKGFGGLTDLGRQVQDRLLKYFIPEVSAEVVPFIDRFIANVNHTAVGFLGFAVLLYTSLSFMGTIEQAFNKIWGIRSGRGLFRRFVLYWTLLTVSPVLAALSLALVGSAWSQALEGAITRYVPAYPALSKTAIQYAVAWFLFGAVYLLMPNTKVRMIAALAGALVSGTLWQLMMNVYVWYNTRFVAAEKVYGALGAIPVFLLWIYVSWIIVLFGAEVAFAVQHGDSYRREIEGVRLSAADRERLAVVAAVEVARPFLAGAAPPSGEDLAARLNAPIRAVNDVLFELAAQGVLREVPVQGRKDSVYLPAKDPGQTTIRDVVMAVRRHGDPGALPTADGREALFAMLDRAEALAMEPLALKTLRDLVSGPGI
jgi:membrane protein